VKGLLLDTHIFLWFSSDDSALPAAVHEQIKSTSVPVYLSWVSAWEIAIKHGMGKLDLPQPISALLALAEQGIEWLPFDAAEAVAYSEVRFPVPNHRDPFDRMLAVQAKENQLVLVTADRIFESYLSPRLLQAVSI